MQLLERANAKAESFAQIQIKWSWNMNFSPLMAKVEKQNLEMANKPLLGPFLPAGTCQRLRFLLSVGFPTEKPRGRGGPR